MTTTRKLKLGRLPNDPTKPRLRLSFTTEATAPPSVDWFSKVNAWPMYGNDRHGDCTCAAAGHMIEAWTANTSTTATVTDQDVISAYSAVSGFDPSTGANDNGAVMQDVLNYWRKTGIGGHKIVAFAQLDHTDTNACQLAAAEFGDVYLGIGFPAFAMTQFNQGKPWDVQKTNAKIEGGHAINSAKYDQAAGMWSVVTWGAEQQMTQAFFDKYVDEAWVAITQDWVDARGQAPTGVNTADLGAQFTALTGQPSPFPAPTPAPAPQPAPTPAPDVDGALRSALTTFLSHRSCPVYLRHAATAWLDTKGRNTVTAAAPTPQPLAPAPAPPDLNSFGPSLIRTVTPLVVAFVVSILVGKGIDPGPYQATLDSLIGASVAAAYYAIARVLEARLGPVWGWLLGLPHQPTYHPPVKD